ncbi:MAG TPA: molybdenum cofactor guanylyltransferase MobA [Spongiibacteraceae bacterium]|nr:molybdenum cofactor guanylyltransferase MobA [Spongiibacteraceae bacterium]
MSHTSADSRQDITAVILAGGASKRMGSDKALLTWQDRPFVAHIIERLQAQVIRIAINTNAAHEFAQFGLPLIADATTERHGPLAGIMAALNYSTTALTLVVPCDNPVPSLQLAARLSAAMVRDGTDLAYAYTDGDNHYLHALMCTDLRDRLAAFLAKQDYAVRHWYATQPVSRVDFSDQAEYFRNINSTEELERLQRS